ncbi:hypothetical protein VNI00_008895 [Paramarasmius palmivorus]|uniref:Ribonuclease H1 N-terminal domain-containing protein n=1 Tax=Paramarasmius palmivorus TaxID=297713 RepID=A0AAW0CT14_9AGAR
MRVPPDTQSSASGLSETTEALLKMDSLINDFQSALGEARNQQAQMREALVVTEEIVRGMLDRLDDQVSTHNSDMEQNLQAAENAGLSIRRQLELVQALLTAKEDDSPTIKSRSSSFSSMNTDVDDLIRAVQLAADGTPIPQLTPVNAGAWSASQAASQTSPCSTPAIIPSSPMRSRNRRAGGHVVLAGRNGGHGVFNTWAEANELVLGVSNPMYRAFDHFTQAKAAYDACVTCGLVGTLNLPWNPSTEWFIVFVGVSPGIHQRPSLMHTIGLHNFERLTKDNILLAASKEEAQVVWDRRNGTQ